MEEVKSTIKLRTSNFLACPYGHTTNRMDYDGGGRKMARVNRAWVGVVLMIVAACGAAALGYGGTGPGIGIKVGANTVDSPIDGDKTTRARVDVEVCSPMIADHHVDFALSLGGSGFGTLRTEDAYTQSGVFYDNHYSDRFYLLDTRLAARFYPLGSEGAAWGTSG
jgi:hypothetical protein